MGAKKMKEDPSINQPKNPSQQFQQIQQLQNQTNQQQISQQSQVNQQPQVNLVSQPNQQLPQQQPQQQLLQLNQQVQNYLKLLYNRDSYSKDFTNFFKIVFAITEVKCTKKYVKKRYSMANARKRR